MGCFVFVFFPSFTSLPFLWSLEAVQPCVNELVRALDTTITTHAWSRRSGGSCETRRLSICACIHDTYVVQNYQEFYLCMVVFNIKKHCLYFRILYNNKIIYFLFNSFVFSFGISEVLTFYFLSKLTIYS